MSTHDTLAAVLPESPAVEAAATGADIATIAGIAADGTALLEIGAGRSLVAAVRFAIPVTRDRVETAVAERQQVVVVFECGDRGKPIVIGFIEPVREAPPVDLAGQEMPSIEADADGRRVKLTARDEIVLQCGAASITLRRNGRVIVRGTYVETHSDGTNRIKGGQVQIN